MPDTSDRRLYFPHVSRNRKRLLEVLHRVLPRQGQVLESVAAHRAAAGVANLLAPLHLDVTSEQWPVEGADAMVCCNMIHIAPWAAAEGLIAGAGRTLARDGLLYLYGPYKIDGRHTRS